MKNFIKKPFHTFIIASFMFFLLFHAESAKQFAFLGLNTWFSQIIPSLLPFMILSGLLIQMNLVTLFCKPFRIFLRPLFKINDQCLYVLITGFLCGFPMGAKNIAQLYQKGQLTKSEGEFLLAFTNNIGPVYFLSFVWNQAYSKTMHPYGFALLFLTPFMYGLVLRYTLYRQKITFVNIDKHRNQLDETNSKKEVGFFDALDTSITSSLIQISILGGYMIFFNLIVLLPGTLFANNPFQCFLHSLLEISGGLQAIKESSFQESQKFLLTHLALSFNGLCCLFQTLHLIKDTDLSGKKYMLHKIFLCSITLLLIFVLHL